MRPIYLVYLCNLRNLWTILRNADPVAIAPGTDSVSEVHFRCFIALTMKACTSSLNGFGIDCGQLLRSAYIWFSPF